MAVDSNDLEGILLVDKPSGMTSHDVVARLRRKLKMKRIGHAGTLDPLATGLLIMLIGKATKLSNRVMSMDKTYEGSFELGKVTNTQDVEGEVQETHPVPEELGREQILEVMKSFEGDQYQTPPMFSAIKIKGVPLYKHARKGQEVEREPRFIRVTRFELKNLEMPCGDFVLDCSKGTYVRTICHDMGQKLGTGGIMTALRRTASGKLNIERATKLEDIEAMTISEIGKILVPGYEVVSSVYEA